jgi:Mn2+/Fe2+ NRAMP family transporter
MGLLLTLIAGLVVWIVAWAVGFKSFDAFLFTIVLVLLAAAVRLALPFLPGGRPRPER